MSPRVIRAARPEDGQAMLEILEQHPTPGDLSLLYTRSPDVYASYMKESPDAEITVCEDANGVLTAQLAILPRQLYVDEQAQKVGYLTGWVKRKSKFAPLPQMLQYGWEHSNCEHLYCSILTHNAQIQAMFDRPHKGLPDFERLCSYQTYLLSPRALMRLKSKGSHSQQYTGGSSELSFVQGRETHASWLSFVQKNGALKTGFPCMERLEDCADLRAEDLFACTSKDEVLAACALWDQRNYKQYIVSRYGGSYQIAAKLGWLLQALGYFPLPKPGEITDCVHLSFILAQDDDVQLLTTLLASVGEALVKRASIISIGATTGSQLDMLLSQLPAISFSSTILATKGLLQAPENPDSLAFQCAQL